MGKHAKCLKDLAFPPYSCTLGCPPTGLLSSATWRFFRDRSGSSPPCNPETSTKLFTLLAEDERALQLESNLRTVPRGEIRPPWLPIKLHPPLRDAFLIVFRDANVGQVNLRSATGGFLKGDDEDGIGIRLLPFRGAPRLHDHPIRDQHQIFSKYHATEGGPFSADLGADLGGHAGGGRVFGRIHEEFVEFRGSRIMKNRARVDDGRHVGPP